MSENKKIEIYDSTLRDGAQAEGISYSLQDKINIIKTLDDFGVSYIEAGNPGSNPKDMELFEYLKSNPPANSKLIAFGSTRKKNVNVREDEGIESLLSTDTKYIAIFGKSWDMHVTEILKTDLEENINMIKDTVSYLKSNGKTVVFDAEHYFDGYKANREYALRTVAAAIEAGADIICLCDTNGGTFPDGIFQITKETIDKFNVKFGIHSHDDCGMAVANSIMAVNAGVSQVQGTMAGFGERCGNANLSAIIPSLQLKRSFQCVDADKLKELTDVTRRIAEISNINLSGRMPYVGETAFSHKAGMHVDGTLKKDGAFEHIDPSEVGNSRRIVMSEAAGRSLVASRVKAFVPEISKESEEIAEVLKEIKRLEYQGYSFEGADGSFELLVMKLLGKYKTEFELDRMNVISEQSVVEGHKPASALVKVKVGERYEIAGAEGDGPVNAIDKALRKALGAFFPQIKQMRLIDYKVRVLDSATATGAKVRVLIESTNGKNYWTTVGVSKDIIKASTRALMDSIEYLLLSQQRNSNG